MFKSFSIKSTPKYFWLPSKIDLLAWVIYCAYAFTLIFYVKRFKQFNYFAFYQDALNYYVSANSKITNTTQTALKNMMPSLNLFTYYEMIFIKMFGNNIELVQMTSTTIISFVSIYLFHRFLNIYNLSNNTGILTILFCLGPFQSTIYRLTPTSDNMFFCLILFTLIFYKKGNFIPALISASLSMICRVEGFFFFLIVIFLYLFRKRLLHFAISLYVFIMMVVLLFFTKVYTKDLLQNLSFAVPMEQMIQTIPCYDLYKLFSKIDNLRTIHGQFVQIVLNFICIFALLDKSGPIFFACLIWFILSLFIIGELQVRLMMPFESIAIVCAIDNLLSTSNKTKYLLIPFLIIYLPASVIYISNVVAIMNNNARKLFSHI